MYVFETVRPLILLTFIAFICSCFWKIQIFSEYEIRACCVCQKGQCLTELFSKPTLSLLPWSMDKSPGILEEASLSDNQRISTVTFMWTPDPFWPIHWSHCKSSVALPKSAFDFYLVLPTLIWFCHFWKSSLAKSP